MKLKDMTTDQLVQEFIPKTIIGTDFTGKDAIAELRRRLMQHDDLVATLEGLLEWQHRQLHGEIDPVIDMPLWESDIAKSKATLARARGQK